MCVRRGRGEGGFRRAGRRFLQDCASECSEWNLGTPDNTDALGASSSPRSPLIMCDIDETSPRLPSPSAPPPRFPLGVPVPVAAFVVSLSSICSVVSSYMKRRRRRQQTNTNNNDDNYDNDRLRLPTRVGRTRKASCSPPTASTTPSGCSTAASSTHSRREGRDGGEATPAAAAAAARTTATTVAATVAAAAAPPPQRPGLRPLGPRCPPQQARSLATTTRVRLLRRWQGGGRTGSRRWI